MPLLTTSEQQELIDRHNKLLHAVHDMRVKQQRYFKSRSSLALEDAKKAEKKVDDLIAKEIEIKKIEQGKMF